MFEFHSPIFLTFLLLLPTVWWLRVRFFRKPVMRYPTLSFIKKGGHTWRSRFVYLPTIFMYLAGFFLIIALARPRTGTEKTTNRDEGIAISIVVDRSLSMGANFGRFPYRGKQLTRLQIVKEIFEEFIFGNGGNLHGRTNDLVSLTAFASQAETLCPFTLSHNVYRGYLRALDHAKFSDEQGTAIGDAIALAASHLYKMDKENKSSYKIKNKVIVLLTDGSSNQGEKSPLEAAELARRWGVKVYCIGLCFPNQSHSDSRSIIFRGGLNPDVDEASLKQIAHITQGKYWSATDAKTLQNICYQLDQLEKSKIQTETYVEYHECFSYFAWIALSLALCSMLLKTIVFVTYPR